MCRDIAKGLSGDHGGRMNREDYRNIQEAVAREIDGDTDADDEEILECMS